MSAADRYLESNQQSQADESRVALPRRPSERVAIVACMDARIDVSHVLGLHEGEAHVIRNAGGVVTDDVLRSLIVSQRLLGTVEVVLIHHTDCGMLTFTDEQMCHALEAEVGSKPPFPFYAFADLAQDVRAGMRRVRESPFLPHREAVRGFIFDVATGSLAEVVDEPAVR